jgi:hypothetical protein
MTAPELPNQGGVGTSTPFSEVRYEVGGEDQLTELRSRFPSQPEDEEGKTKLDDAWKRCITDVQIQVGTLLKTDAVSFLLGAGASKTCGGVLIGKVPIEVERELLRLGIFGQENARVRKWLQYFYHAAKEISRNSSSVPSTRAEIRQRQEELNGNQAGIIDTNYEALLSSLLRWRAAIPQEGGRLRIAGIVAIDLDSRHLDECIRHATNALASCCRLPVEGKEDGLEVYNKFIRKVLTRPLNLKRANIFTLNYDTLVEQAADAEGVVLFDGFVGTLKRVFRPECYDQDLYFPAETTEGRVHRHDRVVHLYKLHGSITWVAAPQEMDNPYGRLAKAEPAAVEDPVVIYPTPTKFGEALGMPYAEMFRRFAACVVRPQSTLFIIGYGFGDEHVNAIIQQALAVPSLTLVIVDPKPGSNFVQQLRARRDQRIWVLSGEKLGTFSGFVQHALPDLRDEDVRRQVMATHRALRSTASAGREVSPDG